MGGMREVRGVGLDGAGPGVQQLEAPAVVVRVLEVLQHSLGGRGVQRRMGGLTAVEDLSRERGQGLRRRGSVMAGGLCGAAERGGVGGGGVSQMGAFSKINRSIHFENLFKTSSFPQVYQNLLFSQEKWGVRDGRGENKNKRSPWHSDWEPPQSKPAFGPGSGVRATNEYSLAPRSEIARSKAKFKGLIKSHWRRRRETSCRHCPNAMAMEQRCEGFGKWRHSREGTGGGRGDRCPRVISCALHLMEATFGLVRSSQAPPRGTRGYKATADPGRLRHSAAQHKPMHMHTSLPRQFMVLTGGTEALRQAVGGVSALALTRRQWRPPQVPQRATGSKTHGQWCTVRDMMHEAGAEPPDHRTGSAGLETGEACQRTSHSLQLPGGRWREGGREGVGGGRKDPPTQAEPPTHPKPKKIFSLREM